MVFTILAILFFTLPSIKNPNLGIEFKDVTFSYDETKEVLSNINLKIDQGKKYVAFVLFPIDEEKQYLEHINRIKNEGNVELIMETIKIHSVPLLVCSAEV